MAARRNHVFREPSVDLTPDDASSVAEVGTPCLALRTSAAREHGVHNDPRPRYVAADLVPHDHRIRRGHAARENLEIRPAYAAVRYTHEHLVGAGVHGLTPLGSTGEFAYLTFEQRQEIVRIVVEAAAGRVPVVPGVAAFATGDAIRQAERYLQLGADALVVILQTMFPVSRSGVERYFTEVAEAVTCPVAIYTNPGLLGGDVPPDSIVTGNPAKLQRRKRSDGSWEWVVDPATVELEPPTSG